MYRDMAPIYLSGIPSSSACRLAFKRKSAMLELRCSVNSDGFKGPAMAASEL